MVSAHMGVTTWKQIAQQCMGMAGSESFVGMGTGLVGWYWAEGGQQKDKMAEEYEETVCDGDLRHSRN